MGILALINKEKKPFSTIQECIKKINYSSYVIILAPATIFFLIVFLIPILALLFLSFNPSLKGAIVFQDTFTLENYVRFFSRSTYTNSFLNSIELGILTSLISLVMSYPLAYLIAKTKHPTWNNILMILILVPLQIDQMVRAYGLMTILGDNGVINATLIEQGAISKSLPLMYNFLGVVIGLTQITIPFMVLSLIGIIRRIDPFFEEAAQNLGANRFKTFIHIIFPLSMPGIFAGTLLVFAISISNFVIPVMLGGSNYYVISMWVYKIINETNNWQFAAAVSSILLIISVIIVYFYNRVLDRYYGEILK